MKKYSLHSGANFIDMLQRTINFDNLPLMDNLV